ncbi:JmjC domain-containing protein 7, partial [Rhizophlyctis rosea]
MISNILSSHKITIIDAADDWPALTKWKNTDYLEEALGSKEVTVAITPNGLADAIFDNHFVLPYEEQTTISALFDKLPTSESSDEASAQWRDGEPAPDGPVYYVQSQNNNLHEDFMDLLKADLPETVGFASEALGRDPDAVNFWLGESRAVTSLHKDHYENLYVVIA